MSLLSRHQLCPPVSCHTFLSVSYQFWSRSTSNISWQWIYLKLKQEFPGNVECCFFNWDYWQQQLWQLQWLTSLTSNCDEKKKRLIKNLNIRRSSTGQWRPLSTSVKLQPQFMRVPAVSSLRECPVHGLGWPAWTRIQATLLPPAASTDGLEYCRLHAGVQHRSAVPGSLWVTPPVPDQWYCSIQI